MRIDGEKGDDVDSAIGHSGDDKRFYAQYVERYKNEPIRVIVRELQCVRRSPQGYGRKWKDTDSEWTIKEDTRRGVLPKTYVEALERLQGLMLTAGGFFSKDDDRTYEQRSRDCIEVIVECQRMIDAASWDGKEVRSLEGFGDAKVKVKW